VKLLIYRGDSLERTLDLTDRDVRIGRGAENDVVLEDPEKTVSRFHAEMRPESGGWVLFDLNSQNGIWIDGQRIQRQMLNPGQTAQMGNFRIILDGGPSATQASAAHAPEAMAATMMLSRDQAMAAAAQGASTNGNVSNAPGPNANAPTLAVAGPGGAPLPPPPAPIAPAVTPKRPKLAPVPGDDGKGIASIPRPIFYGGAAFFLLLIIGVMYVMRPHRQPPPEQPQQQEQPAAQQQQPSAQQNPSGPESNAEIVARHIKEGKTKLDGGDPAGAIESFNKALMIEPSNPEAQDLRMKAQEKKAAATPSTAPSTTPNADPPAGTPSASTPGTSPGSTATPGATPPAGTTGTTGPDSKPAPDKAALAAARKERLEKAAAAALQKRYAQAKLDLSRGNYEVSIPALEGILREKPGYQDAASLLDQAKGLRRTDAQKSLTTANAAASKGDFTGAVHAYERAAKIDPNLAGVQEGLAGVRKQMHDAGQQAYRQARQYDAVGRKLDALPLYQRAVDLLPPDDPNVKTARDRIEALKGQNNP
jgi:tetratricopeptide (TPR) repeat protein